MLIFLIILFIALGIAIKNGKMYFLIAGYNTMSEKEKANVDIVGIATLFRNVLFAMAGALLLLYIVSLFYTNTHLKGIGVVAVVVPSVLYLIVRSNSSKYKLNPQDQKD